MRRTYWMSVEQLATIIAALMLASCVRGHGQFGVEQPMFQMTSTTPSGPWTPVGSPGLQHYWIYTNLPDGTVSGWTDLVQGLIMTRYLPTIGPVKNTNGIRFYSTNTSSGSVLTNTPVVKVTNQVVSFILKANMNDAVNPIYNMFAQDADAGTFSFYDINAPSEHARLDWPAGTVQSSVFVYTNRMAITLGWSNVSTRVFTNGVLSVTVGSSPYTGFPMLRVGGIGTYYNNFNGYIQEIAFWTNAPDTAYYATNWYNYMTNVYPWPCPQP